MPQPPSPAQAAPDARAETPGDRSVPGDASFAWTAPIARGDEAAFERFYEQWFDRTLALARRITKRDEAFCLDVVQDVMLRAVHKLPPLPDERAVTAWMGRTTMRVAIDHLRADVRRRARERAIAVPTERSPDATPPESLLDKERADWLRARIVELSPTEQALLAERFREDKTLAAVGRSLGMSGHAAYGRIHRILRRLRDAAEYLL